MRQRKAVFALMMIFLPEIKIPGLSQAYRCDDRAFSISAFLIAVPGNGVIMVPVEIK